MDDNRILSLLFDRDEAGITAITEQYGPCLKGIACNILQDHHEAEECVNDTYLALWNTIPPQRPSPLLAFASRITRNLALKRLRHRQAQRRRADYDLSLDELAECIGSRSLEEELAARQLSRLLNRFLAGLKPEHRRLFLRRYWFGDSVSRLAKTFSLSENAVSVRLNRIRSKLKDYLIQEGYYEK